MMGQNKKRVGIIIIIIALVIIGAVVWFILRQKTNPPAGQIPSGNNGQLTPGENVINTTTPGSKPRDYTKFDISKEPVKEVDSEALKKMSMAFAERFGSFSNHSNFSNIEDLRLFMTSDMQTWSEKYVDQLRRDKNNNGEFYGIFTRAISGEVKSFDSKKGTAEILVSTRRQETKGANTSAYFDQKILLEMKKDGSQWLTNSAIWQ